MTSEYRHHRTDCADCDGIARGALPRLMDEPRCRQCREEERMEAKNGD